MKQAIKFFAKNAGYSTPPGRLQCARKLALAESFADQLGLEVTWEYEQDDWMIFAGEPENEYRQKFKSGEWECFHAYIQDECGTILASLGGIVLSFKDSAYKRVIEAELKQEAIVTLKQGKTE